MKGRNTPAVMLALLLTACQALAISPTPEAALVAKPRPASPGLLGFKRYFRCPLDGTTRSVGDTKTSSACLAECYLHPEATGCWWLDGTGGFPRDCRICLSGTPRRWRYGNDWALPLTRAVPTS